MKMIKSLLLLLGLANMVVYAQTAYYGQPATLTGKVLIIKSLDTETYKNFKYPAIALNQSLIVDAVVVDDIDDGRVTTKLLQLIDNNERRYNRYFKSNGRNITVYCEDLFREHTIHHNTKVLCVVKDITWH